MKSLITLLAMSFSLNAFAGGGGDGGKILAEDNMGTNIIENKLGRSKIPTLYALHLLELSMTQMDPKPGTVEYAIRQKLFFGSRTIFQALQDAKFSYTENLHACDHASDRDPDACAFKDTGEILFIGPKIYKETREQSGQFQLVGLIAHEVSHLLTANETPQQNEAEARQLQLLVQTSISSAILDSAPALGRRFKDDLHSVIDDVKGAQENLDGGKEAKALFCSFISIINTKLSYIGNNLSDYFEDPGILIPDFRSYGVLLAADEKAGNLLSACLPPGAGEDLKGFKGRASMSVLESWSASTTPENKTHAFDQVIPNLQMRALNSQTPKATAAELADLRNLLQQVDSNLQIAQ